MAQAAADLAEIDAEILRLHQHSVDPDTEELGALLDLSQIDDLLERRYLLRPAETLEA